MTASSAYQAAAAAHEDARIEREAYLLAWGVRFDLDVLQRYLRHTETLFAHSDLRASEIRDMTITARACAIADEITDEQLVAADFPPRGRRTAA